MILPPGPIFGQWQQRLQHLRLAAPTVTRRIDINLVLGLQGWEIERIWFYLLGSALLFLIGLQLFVYWLLLRVLEELSKREELTRQDMGLV